jgi:branched-chain amino acid aminotransferase
VIDVYASGKLDEIFGSGTAAVISPVGEIKYGDTVITVSDGKVGTMSNRFYTELTDIQYGKTKDPAGWIEPI